LDGDVMTLDGQQLNCKRASAPTWTLSQAVLG
jgi:hypothetical protein